MQTKLTALLILGWFVSSCNQKTSVLPSYMVKDSLANISRQYAFTQEGWVAATAVFKTTQNKNAADSVLYYSYVSTCYRQNDDDYTTQLAYADTLLSILNQPGFKNVFIKERAIANINKAHALFYLKRFQDCYYYYCNGSIEASKINDSALTEDLNNHLILFLFEERNYAKAIFYYKKALKDVSGNNKTWQRLMGNQAVLDNIGISFLKQNKADSAKLYFEKAVSLCKQAYVLDPHRKHELILNLGVVYGNLAQAYAMLHQYKNAETMFLLSIAINSQPGYANENALSTQQQLAELYYQEKKTKLAYSTLLQVQKGLDTIQNSRVSLEWNYLMGSYFTSIHQPQKALPYLTNYIQLNDKRREELKIKSKSDILDQMSAMQSGYNVSLLKKDNQVKEDYLWAICLFSLLLIALVLMIFIYFKKSKSNVQKLMLLNKEIRQKQTLLNETLADMEKQNVEKKHILHVVAHDLRNPLSAIHTLAGVVLNEYEYEEDNREYLELIRSACTESNQLISSLLEIAENTDVKYNFTPVDVNELLTGSIPLLSIKASEKKQDIQLITANEKGMIYADIEKINRVVGNLVTNAIKFSPSGSYIEVSASVSSHTVLIKIKDNGIGIPEQYHDKIFNVFTDAKRAGTDGEKTFGLGLSIAKQIVEQHHGKIWFESVENRGTTFYVQFPQMDELQKNAGSEQPHVSRTASS